MHAVRFPLVAAALLLSVSAFAAPMTTLAGDWQRDVTSLSWRVGSDVVWRFSFDDKNGKPFFDPLRPVGGPSLTHFKPEDHPWHYGLWFSWKYINGANYWEEDRTSGKAEGATRWAAPTIATESDGRARIAMSLTYTHPSGRVDMTETRAISVSAPDAAGGYTIDWRSRFVAGLEGAVLDRTPMPGEPRGAVNGGYAGLGVRLPSAPLVMSVVTPDGPVTNFVSGRARPNASAVGCNFADNGTTVAALAILSDPANIGELAPWYLIDTAQMRFADPAVLAPAVRKMAPGEAWMLHYQVAVSRTAWTPESLRAAIARWR
jgi:Methane oxygenase PmoA